MDNSQSINTLKKRFVSDNNLPIDIFEDEIFEYFLDLYENIYGSRSKWESLLSIINSKFEGKSQQFLDEYALVRDNLINSILSNKYYQEFNSSDNKLLMYNLPKEISQYPSKNIYNCENDGRLFLSIDLVKANYSALSFHNHLIFDENKITYEEWVSKFTDLDYIKSSKYTRQVVFGKLNPSRQIKIEKYIIYNILIAIKQLFDKNNISYTVTSLMNDELVMSIQYNDIEKIWNLIKEYSDTLQIPIKTNIFILNVRKFNTVNQSEINIFEKQFIKGDTGTKLKSVPSYYHAQIYKLLNNQELNEYDRLFWFNDQIASFKNNLILIK